MDGGGVHGGAEKGRKLSYSDATVSVAGDVDGAPAVFVDVFVVLIFIVPVLNFTLD